jgi:Transposase
MKFFEALPPCLVGMEACATAHYWARALTRLGHQVRLMPAKDVKAYVKRNKNDAADAEAICEAVRRPTMRFVEVKSVEQQGRLMQHRTRDLLMRQWTQAMDEVARRVRSRTARVMMTLMRNGRDRRSENPRSATRAKSACLWLGPISGSHQGPRPQRLHSKAGYMAAPERFAERSDSFSLHRGRRPYMALTDEPASVERTAAIRPAADINPLARRRCPG